MLSLLSAMVVGALGCQAFGAVWPVHLFALPHLVSFQSFGSVWRGRTSGDGGALGRGVAYEAPSAILNDAQFVSSLAVGAPSVYGRRRGAPEHVVAICDQRHVRWIAAICPVADDVVDSLDTDASWNRVNEPRVHDTMDGLGPRADVGSTVAVFVQGSGPEPAACGAVDLNLREKAGDLLQLESWNREIVSGSHAGSLQSRVNAWSEPARCISTVPARSLYIGAAA